MDILDLVEQGKAKRIFRQRRKISYPGACCHITQRAPGKEMLFLEDADYLFMLHLIKEKIKKFNLQVYSFSLMPNHLHLQIKLEEANLSIAMKGLFENYAQAFNRKYERKGHVFCGSYRQALCFDDNYALVTSIYIHLNPVRAGLVTLPWEYRWSSCNLYTNPVEKDSFVNDKFILALLSKDRLQASKIYEEILTQASIIKTNEVWERRDCLESFKIKLFKIIPKLIGPKVIFSSKNNDILEEGILDEKIKGLKEKKRLRNPQELEARKYLIEQLKARGFSIPEIAVKLNISRQSVYSTLNLTKQVLPVLSS